MAISSAVAIHAFADDIVPYTFTPGSTISANQVNQNFQALSNVMPRAGIALGSDATLNSSYQNIATLAITPRDSGYVLLLGTAGVTLTQGETAGGSSWGYSNAIICITQISEGGPPSYCSSVVLDTPPLHSGDPLQPYSPRLGVPVTIVGSAPVTKDTPVTFYLTAAKESGSVGSSTVNSSVLYAIFFRPGM